MSASEVPAVNGGGDAKLGGDGLDAAVLAGMLHSSASKQRVAVELLAGHFGQTTGGYVAWSGGKDSTAALHLSLTVEPNIPVVWFHSGLEFPETEDYVYRLAETWNINFHILRAKVNVLTLLRDSGQWGARSASEDYVSARRFHHTLVSEPACRAHRLYGEGEVLGLRAEESSARRRLLAVRGGRYTRTDGTVVACPVWSWTAKDVHGYYARNNIEINPVYSKLEAMGVAAKDARVGLVVDGNSLSAGRLSWLRVGWPDLWQEVREALPRIEEWR